MNKKALSIAVILILIALAGVYLWKNLPLFRELKLEEPMLLIPIALLFLLNYFFISQITIMLLGALGVRLRQGESYGLALTTGFYNLITPLRGGMAARALYLKKKHEFSYTNFLASLAASYVLIFLVASLFGLFTSWRIYQDSGEFSPIITGIFTVVFIISFGIVTFAPKFPEGKNEFFNKIVRVVNGWHLIKNNKRVIFGTILVSIVQMLISATMLQMQFRVFGVHLTLIQTLFMSAISSLGIVIAITPAGLGISEAITVFSAASLGITPVQSLSAALLGRLVSIVILFILGPIFSYTLLRKKNG